MRKTKKDYAMRERERKREDLSKSVNGTIKEIERGVMLDSKPVM
jgi:hypothetical protein